MVWLDERNFLHKNRKLAANWTGPYAITKVHDNGVVVIQKGAKSIVVNVDRIKPYVSPVKIVQQNSDQNQENEEADQADTANNEADPPTANDSASFQDQDETREETEEEEWTVVKRKGGRPKKLAPNEAQTHTHTHTTQATGHVINTPTQKALGEAAAAANENETRFSSRLTRARARAAQRAQLNKTQAICLVKAVNDEAEKWRKSVLWYQAPAAGPPFVSDEYGLPKPQDRIKQPNWVYKRRQFLKKLPVAERNLILTGDPAFAFDPVAYDLAYSLPAQIGLYPQLAQQLDYIPPGEAHRPLAIGPDTPVSSEPSTTTTSGTTSPIPPPKTTRKQEERIDTAKILFDRLTTEELPGGHLLRPRPQPQATEQTVTPEARKLWSRENQRWVDLPPIFSQGVSPADYSSLSPSVRPRPPPASPGPRARPPPYFGASPFFGQPDYVPERTTSSSGLEYDANWRKRDRASMQPPTAPAYSPDTSPPPTPAPPAGAHVTTRRTQQAFTASTASAVPLSQHQGPLPPGATVHDTLQVGQQTVLLPQGYTGRVLKPGERLKDLPPGATVVALPSTKPKEQKGKFKLKTPKFLAPKKD